jgi:hypothetical protein
MCLSAFVVAMVGTVFISVGYAQEFQARCGYIAASLRISSFVYGLMVGGIGFGGCSLASAGGFSSRWWRFFRNTTVGLCAFIFLFTLFLR